MLGKGIFQHPDFRKALTILGLAEIFIAPMIDTFQSATNIRSVANRWWYVARPSFPRLLQGCSSWEFARIAREWLSMAQIAVGVGDRTSAYTYRGGAAGRHMIEVRLISSTFNFFGPHHHVDGDPHVVSPAQYAYKKNFADRTDAPMDTHTTRWHFKPFGIGHELKVEPVTREIVSR